MSGEWARRAVEEGRASGISLLESILYAAMMLACISNGDLAAGGKYLDKMDGTAARNPMDGSHSCHAATLLAPARDGARAAALFSEPGRTCSRS